MADVAPAGMLADLDEPRLSIARLYPIGLKDAPATLIAVLNDGTIWELDRRAVYEEWRPLPRIPGVTGAK